MFKRISKLKAGQVLRGLERQPASDSVIIGSGGQLAALSADTLFLFMSFSIRKLMSKVHCILCKKKEEKMIILELIRKGERAN